MSDAPTAQPNKGTSLQARRQAIRRRRKWVWLSILGVLVLALVAITAAGYFGGTGWTFVGVAASTRPSVTYQPAKTLWDWLQLLIIPAVLAVAGYWFNTQQKRRETALARDKQREDLLVIYFDRLSDLMLNGKLSSPTEGVGEKGHGTTIARARTLTTLRRLNGERKGSLVKFLFASGLIAGDKPIIKLSRAHLERVDLHGTHLRRVYLHGTHLEGANLRGTHLEGADLHEARLQGADLYEAHLEGANLREAHLEGANLRGTKYLKHPRVSMKHPRDSLPATQWPEGFDPDKAGAVEVGV